jgi:hypothetical protein
VPVCGTFAELREAISQRIQYYKTWVSGNDPSGECRSKLENHKTVVGEPILRAVDFLQRTSCIREHISTFIRVDQLEELHNSDRVPIAKMRLLFRQMLNRAFGNRDLRVSYRIGARRYGWGDKELLEITGSGARLEERRDYLLVDMDKLLRRSEGSKNWLFKAFAADAFWRRVTHFCEVTLPARERRALAARILGPSPNPEDRVQFYRKPTMTEADRVLGLESEEWSDEWRTFLRTLYAEDPLEAVLASSWGRQTGGGTSKVEHKSKPPPTGAKPWNKEWWRKERVMQGVLQLAARRQQRLLWWGYQDALALSASNITSFIHISHEIWDQYLKEETLRGDSTFVSPVLRTEPIPRTTQAVGIQAASAVWHRKLAEQPGGDIRRRFIDALGKVLRRHMREDRRMSYPGGNGFSLPVGDLLKPISPNREVYSFLNEAVGYGDLYEVPHTTKNKGGEPRVKYYLNPILSPAFQLPAAHTKEPLYWRVDDVLDVAHQAELPFALNRVTETANKDQLRLFPA